MTIEDLDRIETRLGICLPDEYRRFMASYSMQKYSKVLEYTIVDNVDFVINETVRMRLGFLIEIRWPKDYILIGDSGCGDYYCLDLSQLPSPIVCLNHETQSCEEVSPSFQEWTRQLLGGHP